MISIGLQVIKSEEFPILSDTYNLDLISPIGSLIVVLVLILQPHSAVCCLQSTRRLGCCRKPNMSEKTLLTEEEWKYFARVGEQLDTKLSRSIMIETFYLTLKCVSMQGNKLIK